MGGAYWPPLAPPARPAGRTWSISSGKPCPPASASPPWTDRSPAATSASSATLHLHRAGAGFGCAGSRPRSPCTPSSSSAPARASTLSFVVQPGDSAAGFVDLACSAGQAAQFLASTPISGALVTMALGNNPAQRYVVAKPRSLRPLTPAASPPSPASASLRPDNGYTLTAGIRCADRHFERVQHYCQPRSDRYRGGKQLDLFQPERARGPALPFCPDAGLALDSSGNLLFTDARRTTGYSKVTPGGVLSVFC